MLSKMNVGTVALLFSVLVLSGCNENNEVEVITEKSRPVKLFSTGLDNTVEISKFPAVISDNRLVELSFSTGGKVVEFPVKDAQKVKKGDVIAKLDQRDLLNSLKKAKAQFTNADQDYKRAVKLSKSNAIAKNTVEQRLTERDVSRSQLDSVQQAIDDAVLRAPFDGAIAQKMIDNDQIISAGQTVVMFIGGESFEASIDIPAKYLASLHKNESEKRDREAFIVLDVAPEKLIQAKYKEAILLADASTQTYNVTFEFIAPENVLVLPGMNATVELRIGADSSVNRIAIPIDSITTDGSKKYVWVVDKSDMTVSKREVTTDEGVGEILIVTSGLEKDELVVSAGVAYLYEGMKVKEWK
ncbi:efflux RND transporter periplasmic adaptor subunit [Vibrio sp. RC27]